MTTFLGRIKESVDFGVAEEIGPPAANTGKFTVRAMAEIIRHYRE
jgi:hypothetical protein